jgi:hypothetical protein
MSTLREKRLAVENQILTLQSKIAYLRIKVADLRIEELEQRTKKTPRDLFAEKLHASINKKGCVTLK